MILLLIAFIMFIYVYILKKNYSKQMFHDPNYVQEHPHAQK